MDGRPCYEVEFSDGTVIVADAEHQWLTETRASRRRRRRPRLDRDPRDVRRGPDHAEIAATLRCATADRRLNHSVANAAAARPARRADLPVAPYTLGAWLGDGTTAARQDHHGGPRDRRAPRGRGHRRGAAGRRCSYSITTARAEHRRERATVSSAVLTFVPAHHAGPDLRPNAAAASRVSSSSPVPAPTCPDCGGPSTGLRRCQACHHATAPCRRCLRTLGVLGRQAHPVGLPAGVRGAAPGAARRAARHRRHGDAGGSVQFAVTNERLAEDVRELVVEPRLPRARSAPSGSAAAREASSTAYTLELHAPTTTCSGSSASGCCTRSGARARSAAGRASRFIVDVAPGRERAGALRRGRQRRPPVPGRPVDDPDPQLHAGPGLRPVVLDQARHGQRDLLAGDEQAPRSPCACCRPRRGSRSATCASGQMTDDDWTRLARRMGEISEAPLFIDDSPEHDDDGDPGQGAAAQAAPRPAAGRRRLPAADDRRARSVETRQQEVSEFSRSSSCWPRSSRSR